MARLMDQAFPARDQSIAQVIAACSEPTLARPTDNFISNEDSIPRVLGEFESRAEKEGVYLGVGPDQNFSMIARTDPSLAFIVDFRRQNLLLHLLHKALFALSHTRIAYLERLTCRKPAALGPETELEPLVQAFQAAPYLCSVQDETIREVRVQLQSLAVVRDEEWPDMARIQTRIAGPGLNARFLAMRMYPTLANLILAKNRNGDASHFLTSEKLYGQLRQLHINDCIIPIVGDFAGAQTFAALGDWLRARRFKSSVFYVSDVEFFLLRQRRFAAYLANLERIPWSKSALLVRTSTREIEHPQRVAGDSSTTILEPVASFLKRARAGRVNTLEDLFDPRAIDGS